MSGLSVSDVVDGVVEVVLDRPSENLWTVELCRRVTALVSAPPPGAHVIRLRSEGDVFCLGREREGTTPGELREESTVLAAMHTAFGRSPAVTVAEVNGDAAGFGVGVLALCDVAVAVSSARFSFPEVAIGLAPAVVLAWLPAVVGRRAAFWLTATGEPITAEAAQGLGLVNAVAADRTSLRDEVDRHVAALRSRSPRVHAEIKELLRTLPTMPPELALESSVDRLVVAAQRRGEG